MVQGSRQGSSRVGPPGRRKGRSSGRDKALRSPGPSSETQARVDALVKRSGLAAADALRVVQGRVTLNQVLEETFLRQRLAWLEQQGIRTDLAGQVVRGYLSLEKAREHQALWDLQQRGWHRQRWREWSADTPVALFLHGGEVLLGGLREVERYDVVLSRPGGAVRVPKDRVVCYGRGEDQERLRLALVPDGALEDLGVSRSLADRWRPSRTTALEWCRSPRPLRFRLRDGRSVEGRVRRVGFYEIELDLDGAPLILMTHALRKDLPLLVGPG